MSSAIELIAKERDRQMESEGWTVEHDDGHRGQELLHAAQAYMYPDRDIDERGIPYHWPWDKKSWKPTDRVRDLVKAAALIAAEIDRIQRCGIAERS